MYVSKLERICKGSAIYIVLFLILASNSAHGSFESSILGLKMKLTTVILPVISVIGLVIAAMSLYTGNPNAKQHIVYAVIGSIIGFGAQGIVDLISQTVR